MLTDQAYAQLVDKLSQGSFAALPPPLRQDILGFYSDRNAPIATKRNGKAWKKLETELDQLKATLTASTR